MRTIDDLASKLVQIDGKGYKAYKDIGGTYEGQGYKLALDYIQGDPFASPSRIRIILPLNYTGISNDEFENDFCKVALEDYLARCISKQLSRRGGKRVGSGKSGRVTIDTPGQKVLERTAIKLNRDIVEVRLELGLPATGRRVLGREARKILIDDLPRVINDSISKKAINLKEKNRYLALAYDQNMVREYLRQNNAVAFIANGSVLPRESGISDKPMKKDVKIFNSPESMEITLDLPRAGKVAGMLIKEGITLIVGGGYHGKSTLLNAIEMGVYNHIPGDGRELCITRNDAMKIRAEDGRRVERVDIRWFINNLPNGMNTGAFSTENASGSTSQAANIVEAIESGSKLLLIDEDTSATNFMIRDERMQKLVQPDKEPITPFIHCIGQLQEEKGISTILVIGGSGDYFTVAHEVIMMDAYEVYHRTEEAHTIAGKTTSTIPKLKELGKLNKRRLLSHSFAKNQPRLKVKAMNKETISYNKQDIDLRYLEQLIDASQTRALADILRYLSNNYRSNQELETEVNKLMLMIEEKGLDSLSSYKGHPGNLAKPRKQEVIAMLNRFRGLRLN